MNKYKAVIFDMDGLMFNTERIIKRFWKDACQQIGINTTEKTFYKVIGLNKEDGRKILENELGSKFNYDKVRKIRDKLYFDYIEKNGTPIKEGLLDLVEFLEKNNIPKAIASSSSRETVEYLLKNAGLLNNFHIIVAGDEIKRGKPNPDIFLKASDKLKLGPKECLILEDSNAGIKAASNAGIDVIMIPDILEPTEESKNIYLKRCNSLLDVIEILK